MPGRVQIAIPAGSTPILLVRRRAESFSEAVRRRKLLSEARSAHAAGRNRSYLVVDGIKGVFSHYL